jgi:hypothetical protein
MRFSMVALIEFCSKEKGVSWSPQESEFGPPSPGDSMAIAPPNPTPADPVRGAKYRRSSNQDKLMTQLKKQAHLAATASMFAMYLRNQYVAGELDQASKGEIPQHQDPAVPINSARGGGVFQAWQAQCKAMPQSGAASLVTLQLSVTRQRSVHHW